MEHYIAQEQMSIQKTYSTGWFSQLLRETASIAYHKGNFKRAFSFLWLLDLANTEKGGNHE